LYRKQSAPHRVLQKLLFYLGYLQIPKNVDDNDEYTNLLDHQ
ncbi:hypothetical protein CP8484711_1571B, partial [Chlamydia psittaci 84-8471/1]